MKKWIINGVAAFLILAVVLLPGAGFALTVSSSGSASIDWSLLSFTLSNNATVDWTANGLFGPGVSTQGSFSAVTAGVNEQPVIYDAVDFNDGAWTNTAAAFTSTVGTNSAAGTANTGTPATAFDPATAFAANSINASSNVALNSKATTGDVFAQGVLSGQFTVSADSVLTVTVPYALALTMLSDLGALTNSAAVTTGLVLSDFNTTDPSTGQSLILKQDVQTLFNLINGTGSFASSQSGLLTLTYGLFALDTFGNPFVYDFEASATASASAQSVPEPATLILLGSGMAFLAIFRKRFERS
jgi:hypothetical protein